MKKWRVVACLAGLLAWGWAQSGDRDFSSARDRMVRTQVRARGIAHEGVLAAMGRVKRHLFVPEEYREYAYGDHPLPIGHDQTISQPYIVALMTSLIDPDKDDRILEIGTGSGYQTAVLASIAGRVYSVEIVPQLVKRAARLLEKLGIQNVEIRHGDGYQGWEAHAPYDGILVTCAPGFLPPRLVQQLKIGGKMCIPVGPSFRIQQLLVITKTGPDQYQTRTVAQVRFVPMVKGDDRR